MALRDDQQATALGDQIVVGKNYGGAFVTIVENLSFHAVQAKLNCNIHRLCVGLQDVFQTFLDQLFYGQGRNISCAANGHGNAANAASVGVKALIDQLGNMAEKWNSP